MKHLVDNARLTRAVSKQLLEQKSAALLEGRGNRDIMSLIGMTCLLLFDFLVPLPYLYASFSESQCL